MYNFLYSHFNMKVRFSINIFTQRDGNHSKTYKNITKHDNLDLLNFIMKHCKNIRVHDKHVFLHFGNFWRLCILVMEYYGKCL